MKKGVRIRHLGGRGDRLTFSEWASRKERNKKIVAAEENCSNMRKEGRQDHHKTRERTLVSIIMKG